MTQLFSLGLLALTAVLIGCSHKTPMDFPRAEKKPHTLEKHGHTRVDEYFWLREREDKNVISYLEKENEYTDRVMKPSARLQERLFQEMKGRMKEDDSSAPVPYKGFEYYRRVVAGKQYPIHARRKIGSEKEEILLDVNKLAEGKSFTQCSGPRVSESQNLIVYACDFVGRRFYTLRGVNLTTGADLGFEIADVTSNVLWSKDERHFFFAKQDPKTLRSRWIYRYDIEKREATPVFEEKDETYSTYVMSNGSFDHAFIMSSSTLSSEVRYLRRDNPTGQFRVFLPREREHEYAVVDARDRFLVLTNWEAKNFRIMETPKDRTGRAHWREVLAHRSDVYLDSLDAFEKVLTWTERRQGLDHLVLRDRKTSETWEIPFSDGSYLASWGATSEYETSHVRYEYESMRQPVATYDYDLATRKATLIKEREIPNFNADNYRTERIWITARDGVKVPVSLIMPKKFRTGDKAPMLVYAYGSYGASMSPWFSSSRLSLIDRGWVYAIAHIRGGSELGRDWYDQGRTSRKMNTFNDFIDVTEGLLKLGYGKPGHVYARGGSAGGLLMGAVMNMRPDLYNGMVAEVPFVDVITTMLDDSIPLTTGEYDEWGNPNRKSDYDYILKYSPYDNVKAGSYPNLLVTTGLHDSQVQYWEPAKWVARLRDHRQDDRVTLLKTDMSAGHGGASGRYDSLKDEALVQSFLLSVER